MMNNYNNHLGISINPNYVPFHVQSAPSVPLEVELTELGTRLKLSGQVEEGLSKYFEALRVNANYPPVYYNIGVIYSEQGDYPQALKFYHTALVMNSLYVEAYSNIGVIYKNMGNLELAISFYEKALAINPNFVISKSNMAIALTDLGTKTKLEGNLAEGIKLYKKALVYNSQYSDAYYNLGVAYGEKCDFDKAIICYELALHFNPRCCEANNNLGVIYKDRDNLEKALQCYHAAIQINPKFSQTLNNIGVIYTVQGKLDEAFQAVSAAIEVNPDYAEAYNNLGVIFRDEGKISEALQCYEKCLQFNPYSRNAGQNRLLAVNYLVKLDAHNLFAIHEDWGMKFAAQFKPYQSLQIDFSPNRKIRIGYLSPDFFTHSVSYFIEGILKNHNDKDFHITCFSNVIKEDEKTKRFKQYAHSWKNVYGLSAEAAASIIENEKIDILIELTGHTSGNRLDVMAMRPAPIQITYIGYPNTTGLKEINYRITDAFCDPLNTTQKYTEKLVRLPNSFLCYTPLIDAPTITQSPCLTQGFITFGSFNNLGKINDDVIQIWSKILLRLPKSRLIIKCKPFASKTVQMCIWKKFELQGIEQSRVDLLGLIPVCNDHLKTYNLIDISLDTWPYEFFLIFQ
eukprot:TRINITY_DN3765_c0_g1_i2.p1 TRINITY_DN3765_c0_g1~~TRINITY_DN3765_c0_g1_i2.p1  ORF type:complete len:627 (+),score=73.09 TRINITY_DN3765_c0_g1_i2:157-2037(+)